MSNNPVIPPFLNRPGLRVDKTSRQIIDDINYDLYQITERGSFTETGAQVLDTLNSMLSVYGTDPEVAIHILYRQLFTNGILKKIAPAEAAALKILKIYYGGNKKERGVYDKVLQKKEPLLKSVTEELDNVYDRAGLAQKKTAAKFIAKKFPGLTHDAVEK